MYMIVQVYLYLNAVWSEVSVKRKKMSIRSVVAIGIGTALFVVLSYLSIPLVFIPNTSIQTRVALLAYMTSIFGPFVGGTIGFLGHMLADAIQYGSVWWSWVFPEAVFGLIFGMLYRYYAIEDGEFNRWKLVVFNIMQIIANLIAWGIIAPALDVFVYAEPWNKVVTQGILASVGNIVTVGVLGGFLATIYSKMRQKANSLQKED